MHSDFTDFYEKRIDWRSVQEENIRFRKAVKLAAVPADRSVDILDIGCRDGHLKKFLPQRIQYYGIDIAPSFKGERIITADISEGTDFQDNQFDFIFCIEVLEHTRTPFQIMCEIRRILKKDGTLILSIPNPYHFKEILWNIFRIKDRQGHIFSWTRQAMICMAEFAGFNVTDIIGTYLHPPIPCNGFLSRSFIFKMKSYEAEEDN